MGNTAARLKILTAMCLFGSIGLFVRHIGMDSALIALVRGSVGAAFLLTVMLVQKKRPDEAAIKKNLVKLLFSGAFLGINWILLFESYRYTSVAVSTLCYYFAPVIVIAAAPLILKEKLTRRKLLCVGAAVVGMIGVSGVMHGGSITPREVTGILLGLAAAAVYAAIILLNKQMSGIRVYDRTVLQLGISALTMLPYCIVTVPFEAIQPEPLSAGLLITVGIVHTGLAYYLYFGSLEHLDAQTTAIMSYADPVIAVVISVLLLGEPLYFDQLIGAALILSAAFFAEFTSMKHKTGGIKNDL
jgi:RarD protein